MEFTYSFPSILQGSVIVLLVSVCTKRANANRLHSLFISTPFEFSPDLTKFSEGFACVLDWN
jgi:hypothetical protein